MSQEIKLAKPKIIACPQKNCRKKFFTIRDLNIHLKMKHKSDYFIELISGSQVITRLR